jgi:hypothetical protein
MQCVAFCVIVWCSYEFDSGVLCLTLREKSLVAFKFILNIFLLLGCTSFIYMVWLTCHLRLVSYVQLIVCVCVCVCVCVWVKVVCVIAFHFLTNAGILYSSSCPDQLLTPPILMCNGCWSFVLHGLHQLLYETDHLAICSASVKIALIFTSSLPHSLHGKPLYFIIHI